MTNKNSHLQNRGVEPMGSGSDSSLPHPANFSPPVPSSLITIRSSSWILIRKRNCSSTDPVHVLYFRYPDNLEILASAPHAPWIGLINPRSTNFAWILKTAGCIYSFRESWPEFLKRSRRPLNSGSQNNAIRSHLLSFGCL